MAKTSHDGSNVDGLDVLRDRLQMESSDGFRMLQNPLDNPICAISFDSSIPAVLVEWKQYATSTQLQFIHETILELIRKHSATKILGNDTNLSTLHSEDAVWIRKNWLPRAIAAGLKFAANKRPKSYFTRLAVESLQEEVPTSLTLRSFDDITEAKTWLNSIA
jgi:hypothetical protein